MSALEIIKIIFGSVLITGLAGTAVFLGNLFNLRDRYRNWKKEKGKAIFKQKYLEGNPDFTIRLGLISNSEPGKCILSITLINVSQEVKFIDPPTYNYELKSDPNLFQPTNMMMDGDKWPKRLEHGERIAKSVEFQSFINNNLFDYWGKNVNFYVTFKSTTGDLIRSNSIEYDKLASKLKPLNNHYKKLVDVFSKRLGGYQREIYISFWQLQIFNRLTTHIAKQLQQCKIPIIKYLMEHHGFIFEKDPWYEWYRPLEEKKIPPSEVINYIIELYKLKI